MQLFVRLKVSKLITVPVRLKSGRGPDHWSVIKKKKTNKDKALQHFDDFYESVYGKAWLNMRAALLTEHSKYIAVINNFCEPEKVISRLELEGAMSMKTLYDVHERHIKEKEAAEKRRGNIEKINKLEKQMDVILADKKLSEVQSIYPEGYIPTVDSLNSEEGPSRVDESLKPMSLKSIESESSEIELDTSRIINPLAGLSTTALYEYVPATKIKGMDDWILESEHYSYYNKGADFSVNIEKEWDLNFPEHLMIYTHEEYNNARFRSPRRGITGVLDYYLMDGGSILPVLALDLQHGDRVLDMCAAPGGKSYAALQTLLPGILVANDVQESRVNRINKVVEEYFSGMGQWEGKLFVTENDARCIEDKDVFNKILVDVPCTTDRHVLHCDDNNLFKSTRVKERLQIPELQAQILTNALKLISVGGTVVYSTCTLSPIQNDGVVQMALKNVWEETKSVMIVKDMLPALKPLECLYKFGDFGLKYGHIVIPSDKNNWGPIYFCKIQRVQ